MASLYVEDGYVESGYTQTGITVIWKDKVIFIPKTESTLVQTSPTEIRALDLNFVRTELDDIMDGEEGIVNVDTHTHNPPVEVGGVPLARVFSIVNDYTVTFEDGQYAVNLSGANTNLADVANVNQVSVRPNNSAGLVDNTTGGTDATPPVWDTVVGIVDAYQNTDAINVSWGSASDPSEVKYNLYITDIAPMLFTSASLLGTFSGNSYSIRTEADGINPLMDTTYYIGVQAIDAYSNITTNNNSLSVTYVSSYTPLTKEDIAIAVWDDNVVPVRETTSGGLDETSLHNALDSYTNKDDWKASSVDLSPVLNAIDALNDIALVDIEGSTVLAKEATLDTIAASIAAIPTSLVDLTPVLNAIAGLNDVTAVEVRAAFNAVDFQDKNTELEVHTWLDSYTNKGDWVYDDNVLVGKIDNIDITVSALENYDDTVITGKVDDIKVEVDASKLHTDTLQNYTTLLSELDSYTNKDDWKAPDVTLDVASILALVQDVHNGVLGSWEIANNQLVMYRPNMTILRTFDLQNKLGSPTETSVSKRILNV